MMTNGTQRILHSAEMAMLREILKKDYNQISAIYEKSFLAFFWFHRTHFCLSQQQQQQQKAYF